MSPDRPDRTAATREAVHAGYTLLSDRHGRAARAFGIAFRQGGRMYDRVLVEASGEAHHILPVPAVFLLGTDRRIRFEYVNPDYKTRLHADILMAAARVYAEEPEEDPSQGATSRKG